MWHVGRGGGSVTLVSPGPAGRRERSTHATAADGSGEDIRASLEMMKKLWILLLLLAPIPGLAQTRADSALIGRILVAEDRRDSTDTALAAGLRHADARVRMIARRARGRIRDPLFAARD